MPKRLVVVAGAASGAPPPEQIEFGEAVRAAAERLIAHGCAVVTLIGQTPSGELVTYAVPEAPAVTSGLIRAAFSNEDSEP
jgi:hypothetical protein